ncbi:class II fructose-bisphosphate aldolase family protein, partial [Patescibacteria group bacterium]|nr:class II fructose-bisphosphate aldolase family protein [Patescibacteria group bacterium]
MLASVKEILNQAKEKKTAIGGFNISDLITAQAVVQAAEKTGLPAIVQITEKTMEFAGDFEIVALVKSIIEQRSGKIQIGIHLDHGRDFKLCKKAVRLGFNSVMIDGSNLSFEENKNLTKRVVDYLHKHKITVQGELGTVPYLGRHQITSDDGEWDTYMTDPKQAVEFVRTTGIDSLAIGIGNSHGFQKEKDVPDWRRLKQISQNIDLPLILHGASDWTSSKIKKAVKRGISCFNVDTDIRVAYINNLCNFFEKGCNILDPRKVMAGIR